MAKWPAVAVLPVIQSGSWRRHYSKCRHKVNWTWCSNHFERILNIIHSDHIFELRLSLSTDLTTLSRVIDTARAFAPSLKPTSWYISNVNLQGNRFRYRFRLFTLKWSGLGTQWNHSVARCCKQSIDKIDSNSSIMTTFELRMPYFQQGEGPGRPGDNLANHALDILRNKVRWRDKDACLTFLWRHLSVVEGADLFDNKMCLGNSLNHWASLSLTEPHWAIVQ